MNTTAGNDNVSQLPNKAIVKEEAGAWIVLIDQRPLTKEEALELQQWMGRSAFHRAYLEKLARNWDAMSILQELADMFPIANHEHEVSVPDVVPDEQRQSYGNRLAYWFRPSVWVAGLSVAFILSITLFWPTEVSYIEYQTDIGEQASWQLKDGSQLKLNTNSQVELDFSEGVRMVRLLQGEANFDVAKNPNRPFVVYAGSGMVWAVGTAFNVRYNASGIVDVTVTEGTVKVYAEADVEKLSSDPVTEPLREAIATAGQSVQYKEVIQPETAVTHAELDKKLAWHQGNLVFSGETLEQVLTEISRYTDKELIINDPDIRHIQIGGYYRTDDIAALLDTLSKGFGLDVQQVAENRVLLSNKHLK